MSMQDGVVRCALRARAGDAGGGNSPWGSGCLPRGTAWLGRLGGHGLGSGREDLVADLGHLGGHPKPRLRVSTEDCRQRTYSPVAIATAGLLLLEGEVRQQCFELGQEHAAARVAAIRSSGPLGPSEPEVRAGNDTTFMVFALEFL